MSVTGTRESQKNARRRAILDAARTLIRDTKTGDFSMPILAEKAGVSLVTPYNLFGSKANILLEIVRQDIFGQMEEINRLPTDTTLVEWGAGAARVLARIHYANRRYYRRMLIAITARESAEEQRGVSAQSYSTFEPALSRLIAQNKLLPVVPASVLSRYLFHGMSGALQERFMERSSEERFRISLELAICLVLAAACPPADRDALHAHLATLELPPR